MWAMDHVAFQVSCLDAAIAFYTQTLGMKLQFRELDEAHHEAFAFLELEGANLELLQTLDENNQPIAYEALPIQAPYCPHVAIKSDDLDTLIALLDEKGISILKGPLEIPGHVRWLYFADPDGNVLEFVQWFGGTPTC